MPSADAIETRELDSIRVAGKTEPVRIFQLLARRGELDAKSIALRDRFQDARAAYRAGLWDSAEHHFQACRSIDPKDRPAKLFLERLVTLRGEAAPSRWDGVWTLSEK